MANTNTTRHPFTNMSGSLLALFRGIGYDGGGKKRSAPDLVAAGPGAAPHGTELRMKQPETTLAGGALVRLAGADTRALHLAPTDRGHWVTAGATLATATGLAAVTGSIAGAIATGSTVAGIAVGLGLAVLVYVFDRSALHGSTTPVTAGVRLVVSIAMALLVVEPALVVVFADEIDTELATARADAIATQTNTVVAGIEAELATLDDRTAELERLDPDVAAARQAVTIADAGVVEAQVAVDLAQERLAAEIGGTGAQGTSIDAGDGPRAAQIRSDLALATSALDTAVAARDRADDALAGVLEDQASDQARTDTELADIASRRSELSAARANAETTATEQTTTATGLLARVQALEHLAGSSVAMAVAIWTARLLLLALDLGPIVLKLTTTTPNYDAARAALAAREHATIASLHHNTTPHTPPTGRQPIRGVLADGTTTNTHPQPTHRPVPVAIPQSFFDGALGSRTRSQLLHQARTRLDTEPISPDTRADLERFIANHTTEVPA